MGARLFLPVPSTIMNPMEGGRDMFHTVEDVLRLEGFEGVRLVAGRRGAGAHRHQRVPDGGAGYSSLCGGKYAAHHHAVPHRGKQGADGTVDSGAGKPRGGGHLHQAPALHRTDTAGDDQSGGRAGISHRRAAYGRNLPPW